jgi:hypothetical protein
MSADPIIRLRAVLAELIVCDPTELDALSALMLGNGRTRRDVLLDVARDLFADARERRNSCASEPDVVA